MIVFISSCKFKLNFLQVKQTQENQIYLTYSVRSDTPNLMPFFEHLKSNRINSAQVYFNQFYSCFRDNDVPFRKYTKLKRCNKEYNHDYMLLDKQMTMMNIRWPAQYDCLIKLIDKFIIVRNYQIINNNLNVEINESNEENLNEYIIFRLNRMKIDWNHTIVNQLNAYIIKRFKKKASKVIKIFNTILRLFKNDEIFKYLFDYLPYNEIKKSKFLLICATKVMNKKVNQMVFHLSKPIFVLNFDSKQTLEDLEYFDQGPKEKQIVRAYDISRFTANSFGILKLRYILQDFQKALGIKFESNIEVCLYFKIQSYL